MISKPNQTKTCRRCGETLSLDQFRSDKQRKDGLYHICRSCDRKARNGEFYDNPLSRKRENHIERFWSKVKKTDDCWIWIGAPALNGFGSFGYVHEGKTKQILAHRFSYELSNPPLRKRQLLSQTCLNKLCVNPAHLVADPLSGDGTDLRERFWAQVNKTESCWLWTGSTDPSGRGRFVYHVKGALKRVSAHRYSYELTNGPQASHELIYADCDNKLCVNPDHLFKPIYDKRWRKLMDTRSKKKKAFTRAAVKAARAAKLKP